jgi:predicted ATPase with chaperone activity
LPYVNAQQAARVPGLRVLGAQHLTEVVEHLTGRKPLELLAPSLIPSAQPAMPCLSDVRGQLMARRALEVAAAGGHSLLFSGTPGVGKTMLAKRLGGILPALTPAECLEVASVAAFAGVVHGKHVRTSDVSTLPEIVNVSVSRDMKHDIALRYRIGGTESAVSGNLGSTSLPARWPMPAATTWLR